MRKKQSKAPNCDCAVVVYADPVTGEVKGAKYRNISRYPAARRRFVSFVRHQFPTVTAINWYDQDLPKGRNFILQQTKFE